MARKKIIKIDDINDLEALVAPPMPEWLKTLIDTPAKVPANDEFPFAGYFREEKIHVFFVLPDQFVDGYTEPGWYGCTDMEPVGFTSCKPDPSKMLCFGPYPTDEGAYLAAIGE